MHLRIPSHSRGCFLAILSLLALSPAAPAVDAAAPQSEIPAVEIPRVLGAGWQIELVAAEPELVTPVGCCLDGSGRLLVIECHTHFPPADYQGPAADRIYIFDDSDGDGVLDRQRLFYEGGSASMGLARGEDGWIAVATRSEVYRIRDSDGDDVADQREVLLRLVTEATYPHNGLAGLAVGPDGRLYVGQGENLGEPYELIAADGSKQIGGGEGGNIFRCSPTGSDLERVATGFWNPFGLYFDPAGRLWTVGNDPDAMPPCRLLDVVQAGDYGFQFRFGRAGTHPLQAWNGEFPGTLPMSAGTGEAPCAVVGVGDSLWVSSWGENRIERYALEPRGATWSGLGGLVVQGGAHFRPVGMVVTPEDVVYVTDWADQSYPVHGKGRLWRISRVPGAPPITTDLPARSDAERQALRLQSDRGVDAASRLAALDSPDPFIRQAAVAGLIDTGQLSEIDRALAHSPQQRVELLTAWRWRDLADPRGIPEEQREDWLRWGLGDESPEAALAGLRWATERGDTQQMEAIRGLLDRPNLTPRLFSATIAAIAYLESGSAASGPHDPAREGLLYGMASDSLQAPRLRALALQMLPAGAAAPTDAELAAWISTTDDRRFAVDAIGLLKAHATEQARNELVRLALDRSLPDQTRADAVACLSEVVDAYATTLDRLAAKTEPAAVRQEVQRIRQANQPPDASGLPSRDDLRAWMALVGQGGDAEAGRRVFFRTACAKCHTHSGRGTSTGPDLTTIAGQITRERLLESILQPSKEVGPMFVAWQILTTDGQVRTGLRLNATAGDHVRFQGADGETFEIPLGQVETQQPSEQSIMPSGLEETMSVDEFRDLVAFLAG